MIKEKYACRLHDIDAPDLVLWKSSSLLHDDNLEQTKTIRFDDSDVCLGRLNKPRQQISELFGDEGISKEPIHILVALGECGARIFNLTTKA